MKIEIICSDSRLQQLLEIKPTSYEDAVRNAFDKIEQQEVLSRWTDALSGKALEQGVAKLIEVPTFGCFTDKRVCEVQDTERSLNKIWSIGGQNGWYYANWLWGLRGFVDKLAGGVGLRRGRRSADDISIGDSLDFWRVIYANKQEKRLLLYAEMKLPGEAWLEFQIRDDKLHQTATFRPLGLWGRIYWYAVIPFHGIIFKGMSRSIAS